MDLEDRFRVRPGRRLTLADHDPGEKAGLDKEASEALRAKDLRAEEADKNWKFSAGDVAEREHWDDYQRAFEAALAATSTEHAPWYVIPADRNWVRNHAVATIVVETLRRLDPQYRDPRV